MAKVQSLERVIWLDAAKAIAIVFVVMGHVFRGLHETGIFDNQRVFGSLDSAIYLFHMPAFFLISGILYRKKDGITFISRSAWNIALPYFLWASITILLQIALSSAVNASTSISRIWTLPYQPYAIFWFLYALLIIQCIGQVFLRLSSGSWLLTLTGCIALWWQDDYSTDTIGIIKDAATFLIYFAIGNLLSRINLNRHASNLLSAMCFVAFLAADAALVYLGIPFYSLEGRIAGVALALLFIGTFVFTPKLSLWQHLRLVGESTIAIYCMHTIFTAGARVILIKLHVYTTLPHIILGCIFGLIGPLIASDIIRRLGIQKYLGFGFSPPTSSKQSQS